MYSNGYIFRYASIMVILVAAILSAAAMLLKPAQQRNEDVDKMQSILAAAGLRDVPVKDAIQVFNKSVTDMIVIDKNGSVVDDYKDDNKQQSRAFKINLKDELYKKSIGKDYELALYVIEKDGEKIYIVPLRGVGLWGPIWGNIALKSDFKTVIGVTFGHKSETPGLGAEIETVNFQNQFPGKLIFDENGNFTSVRVIKGGIANIPVANQIHAVDAVSGGTITSNGTSEMLKNVLESYVPYFKKQG